MAVRFSEDARRVVESANAEAGRFGHEYVGTEHLLLALTQERSGIPVHILERFGVTGASICREVERIVQTGPGAPAERRTAGRFPYTPRGKSAIELAIAESRTLGDGLVRGEHLLLGLLRETDGVAFVVLNHFNVKVEAARAAIPQERERNSQIPKWLAWKEGTVAAIARAVAADRNWQGLPLLADALEEAGCDDREILDHLRQMGSHPCRAELQSGCWVLHRLFAAEAIAEPADELPRKRWWQFWR